MAEATQYMFKHQEVVTALIKHQGLHEGQWQIAIQFGFAAANVGADGSDLNPAAICPVIGVGLQRATEKTNLMVDAAKVNPAPKKMKK
jgi:hypothetical protein